MVDIDIGFHLHGGKWIWQHRAFPDKDAYTYTVPNNDYIDLHWLYQLLMFGVYSLFRRRRLVSRTCLFFVVERSGAFRFSRFHHRHFFLT
ncbi:MAG: hypothetical protein ACK412_00150 [Chloroherpetonaceae bacterium]